MAATELPGLQAALDHLQLAAAAGAPIPDLPALDARSARALELARAVGAPLLPAIDAIRQTSDDVSRAARAVTVASAQARAVAVGLLAAPILLVPVFGRLLGVDVSAFYRTPTGQVVALVGLALLALGGGVILQVIRRVGRARRPAISRRSALAIAALLMGAATIGWSWLVLGAGVAGIVVRRAQVAEGALPAVDEVADLMATALGGGLSAAESLRLVADQLPGPGAPLRRLAFGLELGMPPAVAVGARADHDALRRLAVLVEDAERLGAPVAPSLRRLAVDLRAEELARVLADAERLPVLLTFPTALCLLPATVLLIGAPIVHAGLQVMGT